LSRWKSDHGTGTVLPHPRIRPPSHPSPSLRTFSLYSLPLRPSRSQYLPQASSSDQRRGHWHCPRAAPPAIPPPCPCKRVMRSARAQPRKRERPWPLRLRDPRPGLLYAELYAEDVMRCPICPLMVRGDQWTSHLAGRMHEHRLLAVACRPRSPPHYRDLRQLYFGLTRLLSACLLVTLHGALQIVYAWLAAQAPPRRRVVLPCPWRHLGGAS